MANNLLLIDESPLIHRVVELTFEGHDVSVYSSDDVDEGLALVRSLKPDLVIASTHIKQDDGLEFCRELQGDSELADIPVLLLAGSKENLSKEDAHEVGAIGVLTKPFEPESLLSEVGLALSWTSPASDDEDTDFPELDDSFTSSDSQKDEISEPVSLQEEPEALSTEEFERVTKDQPEKMVDSDASTEFFEGIETLEEETIPSDSFEEEKESGPQGVLEDGQSLISPEDDEGFPDLPPEATPSMDIERSAETTSEAQAQEKEIFEEMNIEEIFDEYSGEAETEADESPTIEVPSAAEEILSEDAIPDFDEANLQAAEDELASLQEELKADLEEIGGPSLEEGNILEAEEELDSLEAELGLEKDQFLEPKTIDDQPESTEGLELEQEPSDIDDSYNQGIESEEDTTNSLEHENAIVDEFLQEKDALPENLVDEQILDSAESAENAEKAELSADSHSPAEDLSDNQNLESEESPKDGILDADEVLDSVPPSIPPVNEISSGAQEVVEAPGPDPSSSLNKDVPAIDSLVEQSLEKSVQTIVPAILGRVESIIVERLPDMVERIVLREIEKIKRGE